MKTNRKTIFALIIVSLIIVAGCNKGSEDRKTLTDADIRKGTDGLEMIFTENAPPERVFEKNPFPVAVELRNLGVFNIGDEIGEFEKVIPNGEYNGINIKRGIVVFGFEKAYVDGDKKDSLTNLDATKISEIASIIIGKLSPQEFRDEGLAENLFPILNGAV